MPRRPRSGSRRPSAARPRPSEGRRHPGPRPRSRRRLAARPDRDVPPRGGGAIAAAPEFDVAVIGGGAAGLWTALRAAEDGARVCLVSRTPLSESASYWAQGGLAAALEPGDSPARHAADTIAAGRGLCRPSAVQVLVEEAPAAVRELRERGVAFDLDPGRELALGLGGRSYSPPHRPLRRQPNRAEITSKLAAMVAAEPRIAAREKTSAPALWSDGERCHGVLTDARPDRRRGDRAGHRRRGRALEPDHQPPGRDRRRPGPGGAAGADLADLEFCQFHPTALALPDTRFDGLLITEAVRGEGARCSTPPGGASPTSWPPATRSPRRSSPGSRPTAPPASSSTCAALDPTRFPNVFASCAEAGLDPRREPVPVSPAAHYMMGGIAVDLDGRSSLPGLFAVGECSCTGLHGANRLASNSLSECFVFGGARRRGLAGGERPGKRPAAPRVALPAADRGDPRRGLAPRRPAARRRRLERAARATPTHSPPRSPPAPWSAASPAAATCAPTSPSLDHELDGVHIVLGPDGETRREEWRVSSCDSFSPCCSEST